LLNAYERGLLSDVEYVERSGAIESAGSVEELNRIVQELPVLGANRGGTPLPGSAVQAPAPPLSSPVTVGQGVGLSGKASLPHAPDPVDLARLGKTTPGAGQGDHRWFALVVIVVLFIVLIIFGAVLIGRVHANNTPSSSTHIPSLVKVASRA
jgi:hypothetical protein